VLIKGNKYLIYPYYNSGIKHHNEIILMAAVRFFFTNAGVGNLSSKELLPVAPFRTHDWELDTSK